MKKLMLIVVGVIAGIIAVSNLGSIMGLLISALIAYTGVYFYKRSESTLLKLFWAGVLVIGLITAISNVPAFVGIVSAIGVYYIWKSWSNDQDDDIIEHKPSNDPFANFEKQWDELNQNHQ